jgi:hypothetical protein
VGDGDVLQGDVELRGTLEEVCTDAVGDGFTLGDELCGVELGDDGLEDFVSDGGEDTLVVIGTVRLKQIGISIYLLRSRSCAAGSLPGKSAAVSAHPGGASLAGSS